MFDSDEIFNLLGLRRRGKKKATRLRDYLTVGRRRGRERKGVVD